ncbi:GNAT family N-acetyltransferase [Aliiroseovarius sp. F20344]|uniref:GNAT family N-acetyltransferase n=1 Tax=Aliiroseovarius sp. F20344 TaxID=2926414 RepID=UPI001FF17DEA|nr:GNAT family N-acetyltransferase [Aliiroseovarius sp. F20344]MCK0142210.1 N-acetyltransferase family protein [Aliiroseovarius sp. F20344]
MDRHTRRIGEVVRIRAATVADAAAILELWNLAILETLITFNSVAKTLEDVTQMIATVKAVLVAEENGDVLGYASLDQFRTGAGYTHTAEHAIMLAPKARGKGFGRALMQALETEARVLEFHSMIAGVSASNPMGEPFHKAVGFKTVGVIPEAGRKFDQWHDLILMQKTL